MRIDKTPVRLVCMFMQSHVVMWLKQSLYIKSLGDLSSVMPLLGEDKFK